MLRPEQLRSLSRGPLAIDPQALSVWMAAPKMAQAYSLEIETPADERIEATGMVPAECAVKGLPRVSGAIQVLRMYGGIEQHDHDLWDIGTSTEGFTRRYLAAISDPTIGAVIVDIQSPGGSVFGVFEAGDVIYNSRGTKPVIGLANSYAASAAYGLGSAFEKLYMTPGGKVGSVGVFALHQDVSKALDDFGVKMTFISAGKYKVEGNPFEPLGEEAKAAMQASVDAYYQTFVKSVARNRGVKVSAVEKDFGQGRMLSAADAVAAGMVDGTATMTELLAGLGAKPKGGAKAEGFGDPDVLSRKLKLMGA